MIANSARSIKGKESLAQAHPGNEEKREDDHALMKDQRYERQFDSPFPFFLRFLFASARFPEPCPEPIFILSPNGNADVLRAFFPSKIAHHLSVSFTDTRGKKTEKAYAPLFSLLKRNQ